MQAKNSARDAKKTEKYAPMIESDNIGSSMKKRINFE